MENYKFKKLLIILTVIFIISILTVSLFFLDYILNLKKIINNKLQSYIFIKWIIIGFLINLLITILIILSNVYLKNIKGSIGPSGYKGEQGIKGDNCYICL